MSSAGEGKSSDGTESYNLTDEQKHFIESYYEYTVEYKFNWVLTRNIIVQIFQKINELESNCDNVGTEISERCSSYNELLELHRILGKKINKHNKIRITNRIKTLLGLGDDETVYKEQKKTTLQLKALSNTTRKKRASKSKEGGKRKKRKKTRRRKKTKRRKRN